MSTRRWIRCRVLTELMVLGMGVAAARMVTGQSVAPANEQAGDAAAFKEFSARVQAYVQLQRTVKSGLPTLKPTDLPEMIAAYQQVLARKIREARPHAKPGDLFTPAAREAFRRACRAAIEGPNSAKSLAYMQRDAPNPGMHLEVNGVYPDAEPITPFPPELLAAFPPLPVEVAYRIVGRTLILVDVESRVVVDIARSVLPPSS